MITLKRQTSRNAKTVAHTHDIQGRALQEE